MNDNLIQGDCSLPPLQNETSAFWVDLPLHIKRAVETQGLCPLASIHAASHAIAAVAPWFAQCDTTDLDTEHASIDSALVQPFRIMVRILPLSFFFFLSGSVSDFKQPFGFLAV